MDISEILESASGGDEKAAAELLPLVYAQLRKTAQLAMNNERDGHTLSATALVHEAYARLVGAGPVRWGSQGHFFVAAAESMRRILIEHARARGRMKRGGGLGGTPGEGTGGMGEVGAARKSVRVSLDVVNLATNDDPDEIMAVDDAIRRLEQEDPSAGAVVRLRFFAGLDVEQTAAALGISVRTVMREWAYARAVLHRALEEPGAYAPKVAERIDREPDGPPGKDS